MRADVIWITHDKKAKPDIVVYYVHGRYPPVPLLSQNEALLTRRGPAGGGHVVLSAKFYVEFLLGLKTTLLEAGFKNPAILTLEYTLAPDKKYPYQLHEALLGYKDALKLAGGHAKLVLGGDSAGGMMTLTVLQELAARKQRGEGLRAPDLALLVSPWVTLTTHLHKSTSVDYIQPEMLERFAELYTGGSMLHQAPCSPGNCQDESLWRDACPTKGYLVTYGEDECLVHDIRQFIKHQAMNGAPVKTLVDRGGVHVWPVVSMHVSGTNERRLQGLRAIANEISTILE